MAFNPSDLVCYRFLSHHGHALSLALEMVLDVTEPIRRGEAVVTTIGLLDLTLREDQEQTLLVWCR